MTDCEYDDVMKRCSALRTALTQDLETRSSRPMWNPRRRLARRHWYDKQEKAAKKSISAAEARSAQRAGNTQHVEGIQAF